MRGRLGAVGRAGSANYLHRGLSLRVRVAPESIAPDLCIACGKHIPTYKKVGATTCSARCGQHVVSMRRVGKPIEWTPTSVGRGTHSYVPTPESNAKRSAAMKARIQRQRSKVAS